VSHFSLSIFFCSHRDNSEKQSEGEWVIYLGLRLCSWVGSVGNFYGKFLPLIKEKCSESGGENCGENLEGILPKKIAEISRKNMNDEVVRRKQKKNINKRWRFVGIMQ
jgi:hypothetical protein